MERYEAQEQAEELLVKRFDDCYDDDSKCRDCRGPLYYVGDFDNGKLERYDCKDCGRHHDLDDNGVTTDWEEGD